MTLFSIKDRIIRNFLVFFYHILKRAQGESGWHLVIYVSLTCSGHWTSVGKWFSILLVVELIWNLLGHLGKLLTRYLKF